MTEPMVFSIVVPAHNEEGYIEETLACLAALDYPRERFEVVVIENASTDATRTRAERFASENISIISIPESGVARARNEGMLRAREDAAWIVLLDADTHVAPEFLHELSEFLAKSRHKHATVGTTSLRPFPDSAYARAWYGFHDISHALTRSSASIILVRRDVVPALLFDEQLRLMEDLNFVTRARKRGGFCMFWTDTVSASTRRYVRDGWLRLFLLWLFVGVLPKKFQVHFQYEPVR